ncbi:MAG: tetratricopeptide repeat protein, partial [Pirellulales bacterium]|nr:tetratricopeptide repeat protein [Pirellulales bacterium]
MSESEFSFETKLAASEQEILDTALQESDQLLARSLQDDQRRRRLRLTWLSVLVIGGAVVCLLLLCFALGWFTLGPTEVAVAEEKAAPEQSIQDQESVEQAEEFAKQGWDAWKKQDYNAALAHFERAIGLDPQSTDAWNGSGWVQFNSGDSQRACESFLQCLRLAPKHAAALNGLGQVHFSWKEYDKASKYLLRAAKQDATAAWSGLAKLYLLTGDYKKAKVWAERLAQREGKDSFAQQMLAAAEAGKLSEELRRQIEPAGKKTTSETANFQQGWQHFFRGKYRSSEKIFREVLKTDKKNPHAMNGLGWSLLNQGKHEEAKTWLQKALKLETKHWGAMNGMATILKAEGKLDEAIVLWERIEKNAEGANSATGHVAAIYLERKQYDKALRCYE